LFAIHYDDIDYQLLNIVVAAYQCYRSIMASIEIIGVSSIVASYGVACVVLVGVAAMWHQHQPAWRHQSSSRKTCAEEINMWPAAPDYQRGSDVAAKAGKRTIIHSDGESVCGVMYGALHCV